MNKPSLRLGLFLCLLISSVSVYAPRARADIELPPASSTNIYEGTVIWQRPDGSTLRGRLYLLVWAAGFKQFQSNGRRLSASLSFGSLEEGPFYHSYLFTGKMDPNGRGFLRFSTDNPDSFPLPLPELNPGRVPVQLIPGGGFRDIVVSGGVLAADGTQMTLRADYVDGIVVGGS